MSLTPIDVQVGDTIERIGCSRIESAGGKRWLDNGCIGTVVAVQPARKGTGVIVDYVDGEGIPDPDRNGYAVVSFPTWLPARIIIRPEDAGKRWKKS